MTAIVWDQPGDRIFEAGLDRGVLYPPNGAAVPWNGLTSVTEKAPNGDGSPVYFDGVKIGAVQALGDYAASLKAYTYPTEFLDLEGTVHVGNGLYVANQKPQRFGLTYRTKIGNDVDGPGYGYKLHILYNLLAVPSQKNYRTNDGTDATEFEWSLTAIPGEIPGFRPTAHLIFDSRMSGPLLLEDIERTLYGDAVNEPKLPDIATLVGRIGNWVIIRITDNFDGTWTAEGPDELISMLDPTTFQIIQANATYLDADTYVISDSTY